MITALLPTISNYSNQHNKVHLIQERQTQIIMKVKKIHTHQQALYKHSKKPLMERLLHLIIELFKWKDH